MPVKPVIENLLGIMKNQIHTYFNDTQKVKDKKDKEVQDKGLLKKEIKKAHQQWLDAKKYFENVSDPELIDYASYRIEAARTKYMYLLNKAKKANDIKEVELNNSDKDKEVISHG